MSWIKTLFVNVAIIAAFLFAIEVIYSFLPVRYKIIPPHEPRGYLQFDAELGYDIAPHQERKTLSFADASFDVWSNSLGCFDEEYDGTSPYIYLTGDSFTWGWAPFEEKWGTHIEKLTGTQVLTCGVNGYGTRQEFIKTARQLRELPHPEMIIIGYFGSNDVDDDQLFPNHTVYNGYSVKSTQTCPEAACVVEPVSHSLKLDIKAWLATHSVLYTLLQREVYAPLLAYMRHTNSPTSTQQEVHTDTRLPSVHTDAMLGFGTLAKNSDTKLLVVLIPNKTDVREDGSYSNERMKAFLEAHNIEYVDLLPTFKDAETLPDHPLYWSFDGHWNIEGNRLAGETVARYIATMGR